MSLRRSIVGRYVVLPAKRTHSGVAVKCAWARNAALAITLADDRSRAGNSKMPVISAYVDKC